MRASLDYPHGKVQGQGLAQALPLAEAPVPGGARDSEEGRLSTYLASPAAIGEELAAGPTGTKRERVVGSAHIHRRSEHKGRLQPSHASGKSGVRLWKPGGSCGL